MKPSRPIRLLRTVVIIIIALVASSFLSAKIVPMPFPVVPGRAYTAAEALQLQHAQDMRMRVQLAILVLLFFLTRSSMHLAYRRRLARQNSD